MIFVTGDTHGFHDFGKLELFRQEHEGLTKEDYVIIAGDFGGVWSEDSLEEKLKPYSNLPFTVLFVDGNHENFDMLNAYPVEKWHGGKVRKIKPDIIHLMRGQVFEIEGRTFFTFGGATSVDKKNRKQGVDWWAQEMPSYEEYDEAIANLQRYKNKVDYVITHSCSERTLWYPPLRHSGEKAKGYPENGLLYNIENTITYRHWYFGHFHQDAKITDKITLLYHEIVQIPTDEI